MHSVPITRNGYEKLKNELHDLEAIERPKIIDAIQKARALGDLSENAEYKSAKEMQGKLDYRISYLRKRIPLLQITDLSKAVDNIIRFGAFITLIDIDTDKEIIYQLVGEDESSPEKGSISIKSPVGKCSLGKSVGDFFKVITPGGTKEYEVKNIDYR
ncbi:transcription elongation factor GreA [Candidatus Cytomitobacter primus]|uniref:Transcription elongation factor GreA n=1 Tax=Candidatus Cytomitobacter primus TaxID=2066024 RepID=A0A5C0UG04_9PROT|nr:transcription elongation factor GreA [Candidatus Cytomitobacter primus]QEK38650.1 transcription elongation factor GreA [Candidatus Cytomitobacter primus]